MRLPPTPKWRPTVAVDIERTAKTFAYSVDGKHAFAVLKPGTCVRLPPRATDPKAAAAETMWALLHTHPDARLRGMDDGNYAVWYSQPAASVAFADVVRDNWAYIEANHLDGLVDGEVLRTPDGKSLALTEGVKITLFARSYMFMDALAPEPVLVCRTAPASA